MGMMKDQYHEEMTANAEYAKAVEYDAGMAALYDNYVPRFKENQRAKPFQKDLPKAELVTAIKK